MHVQYAWLDTEEAAADAYERYELHGATPPSVERRRGRFARFFNPLGDTCLGRILVLHSTRVARWEAKQRKRSDSQMRAALQSMDDGLDGDACAAYRRMPPHARPGYRRAQIPLPSF